MIRSPLLPALLTGLLFAASAIAESPTPWKPPPGEYKVDMTTTTRWQTPMGVAERIEHRDGETGQTTVTSKAPDSKTPVVRTMPGDGPVRECQYSAFADVPGNCIPDYKAQGELATVEYTCMGQHQQVELERVGERVWEKRLKSRPAQNAAPTGMNPKVAEAMAPVIAKMEARAKQAPPAEAAQLRQQIAAIQRSGGPVNAAEGQTVESVQRWTWVGSGCSIHTK